MARGSNKKPGKQSSKSTKGSAGKISTAQGCKKQLSKRKLKTALAKDNALRQNLDAQTHALQSSGGWKKAKVALAYGIGLSML
jgi:hypothetical protein